VLPTLLDQRNAFAVIISEASYAIVFSPYTAIYTVVGRECQALFYF
jgi:hypothetical protein